MGFMAAGSVILGIAPQLAVNYLLNPILGALQLSAVQVTWFGLSSDAGSFSTMGGLVLAVVSLVVGGVIYALAYASRPAAVVVTGGAARRWQAAEFLPAASLCQTGKAYGERLLQHLHAKLA